MPVPEDYSFIRYLSAKKSVDDRALNRPVWDCLKSLLPAASPETPLRVLEVGAGIGTMFERALDWDLLSYAHYTAIDAEPQNIQAGAVRLARWGLSRGYQVSTWPDGATPWTAGKSSVKPGLFLPPLTPPAWGPDLFKGPGARRFYVEFTRPGRRVTAALQAVDLASFAASQAGPLARGRPTWDLLIAHAFLDLLDMDSALPVLFSLLRPGGLFYFTLNFDGATLLEPPIDPALDDEIQALYHRTMDERRVDGRLSGDSRTGRRLFSGLQRAGGRVLAAGASDWVVFPGPVGYPEDEAYFLHFILHTIQSAMAGNPALDPQRFAAWAAGRHAQVESGELVYVAHQLDFAGVKE